MLKFYYTSILKQTINYVTSKFDIIAYAMINNKSQEQSVSHVELTCF